MITSGNLAGAFTVVLICSLALSLLLNPVVRQLYRRSVTSAMRAQSNNHYYTAPQPTNPNSKQLAFVTKGSETYNLQWRLGLRYLLALTVFAASMTAILFILSGFEFYPLRTLVVFLMFLSGPLGLVTQIIGFRWYVGIALITSVCFIVLMIVGKEPLFAYLFWIMPATVIALLVANPYFRTSSIPILILALLLSVALLFVLEIALFLLGSGLFNSFIGNVPSGVIQTLNIGISLVIVLLAGGFFGLLAIRLIAWTTTNSTELMMQADMVCAIQCIWMIIVGWNDVHQAGFAYLTAFALYRLVLHTLPKSTSAEPNILLLLRVFGNKHNQEILSRKRLIHWRHRGPVLLIGAEDLATETLNATELSAFLNRRIDTLFIKSPQDLDRALRSESLVAADGLYPMRDYYCRDNSWKPTIRHLMSQTSAVLLDLRGFSKENLGIQFEINELAQRVSASKIRILVDDDTDIVLAKRLFSDAWEQAGSSESTVDQLIIETGRSTR